MKIQKIKAALAALLCVLSVQLGFAQRPGNITGATPVVWLTPDGYSNGTWANRISGTTGNFVKVNQSPTITAGYNYHPSVVFDKSDNRGAPKWLQAQVSTGIASTEDITSIFVLKRKTGGSYIDQDFFSFQSGSTVLDPYHLVWNKANDNNESQITLYWPKEITWNKTRPVDAGIITIDNANNSSGTVDLYNNGKKLTGGASIDKSVAAVNPTRWVLGAGYYNAYGYEGEVQEVIILKANGNSHLAETELLKLHSYLAIKYGISLPTNYVNSSGQVVWNRTANNGYNNDIFGIARDDSYGLHQKQSTSVTNSIFTTFVGANLMPLNSQNTSVALADGVYAMFGSNGVDFNTVVPLSDIPNSLVPSHPVNYRKGLVYKVQVTGASTIKLKMRMPEGILLPEYILISSSPDFTAATTRIIPRRGHIIEEDLPDGSYIAFGGHQSLQPGVTPAGITSNTLKMWLDAGNESSIKSTNEDLGASVLGHTFKGYLDPVKNLYPQDALLKPVNNRLNTVQEWRDDIRGVKYELNANVSGSDHRRIPVYSATPLEMNYHPAVQFWGNDDNGSYLSNLSGVFGSKNPTSNKEHTAIFVVNNYPPVEDDRSYYMAFGADHPNGLSGYYPTYGIRVPKKSKTTGATMNTRSDKKTVSDIEYATGSTAIMAYRTDATGSDNITFGINGRSEQKVLTGSGFGGDFEFNGKSTLGIGYKHDRQLNGLIAEAMIFDEKLSSNNLELVEAYLAIKYGITLRKSASVNYDYKMRVPVSAQYPAGINAYWEGTTTKYSPFHHNVAAIIRDDASNLSNRQSHSTESGSMLHVGIGGVPEAVLDKNGTKSVLGSFDNDKEVVVWGHNTVGGFYTLPRQEGEGCGKFESVFQRRWLLHKVTNNDRPMQLLVGLQNNAENNLGLSADDITQELYSKLIEGNEVYMIVATSMAGLDALTQGDVTQLKAVVPMTYSNNEFQCSYNFTESDYYITFGVRVVTTACVGTKEFTGKKTFNWTQYKCLSQSNPAINTAKAKNKNFGSIPFDLGNGITGKTNIKYENNIEVPRYYPSNLGAPKNGITIRRIGGDVGSKVTVTIEWDDDIVVKPEFRISGIDEYLGRYERVEVTGYCSSAKVAPQFRPVSSKPAYTLDGHYAVMSSKGIRGASNKKGAVDVSFRQGVNKIVIEYTLAGKAPNSVDRNIYISPISCTSVNMPPPPSPVDANGMSFTKEVESREITTCQTMQYSFYITNANYGHQRVNFTDVLPDGLKWQEASVAVDTLGFAAEFKEQYDPALLTVNNYEGGNRLEINNIFVPCNSTVKLTAVVEIDSLFAENSIKTATGETYTFANRAAIDYEIGTDKHIAQSVDRQTLEDETVFTAVYSVLQEKVQIEASFPNGYREDEVITVKLKVTNNNDPIDEVFLNVAFDAGFEYIAGSYTGIGVPYVDPIAPSNSLLTIINSATGDWHGFTLPTGETEFTFQLKAPQTVEPEYDINGNPIAGTKATLNIAYDFTSETADDCGRRAMENLEDVLQVPYRTAPKYILINQHLQRY